MEQELWAGIGPHPDQVEEEGYAERCAETLRQILREEHKDYFEQDFELFWGPENELTPEYPTDVPEWMEAEDTPF